MTEHTIGPIARHTFYQPSLFPADTLRLRIEIGHCRRRGLLMLATEIHDMPTRELKMLELEFTHDALEGWSQIEAAAWSAFEAFREDRGGVEMIVIAEDPP